MALRPNNQSSGAQLSPNPSTKQFSSPSSSSPSLVPAPSVPQNIPSKTPSRLPPKSKGLPRGTQGSSKRTQTSRKSGRKGLFVDDAFAADPIIETAMYGPTNRRGQISLNHLLNFSIAPREQHYFSNSATSRRTPSYGIGSGHHPADKARFIQANHRFVVRPNGDYRPQSTDPDSPIPWESILQILVSPQTHMTCPICLAETPVAPRMTRCGHIACLPCFIRYFASEDVATGLRGASLKFRKCPICWDSIQLSEVKPVKWYSIDDGLDEDNVLVASEPREGFDVAMRLFMRKPGTTLSLPRDDYLALSQVAVLPEGDVPWHYVPEILHYAWIVKGSASYMHTEAQREITELEQMEKEDETTFGEDGFWTQKAVQRVRDHAKLYDEIGEGPSRQVNLALSSANRKSETLESETPYQYSPSPARPNQPREAPYLFYQPRSASHYYLSGLDIRILRRAFGEYENFPSAILARVEHITSPQTIDDEFRRRVKYLGHVPSGSQVSFLECDWSEMVDKDVLATFTPEIEKRRRLRREKLVREEKERDIEERNRRYGRRTMGNFASYDDDGAVSKSHDSEDVKWVIANAVASVQSGTSPDLMSTSPFGSSLPALSTSADTSVARTVWGTPRITPTTSTPNLPLTPKEVDEDLEEPGPSGGMWSQNWEEMLTTDKADTSKIHGSRKKKGKKLVLMSNSVKRGT